MATCKNCGNNCGSQGKCGCNDSVLHLPPNCNPPNCPNPEPCGETFSDCCVIHNGDTFTYFENEDSTEAQFYTYQGERWCDIWQRFIVSQYCTDPAMQPPVGLKSTNIGANSISIAWAPVSNVQSYEIYYKSDINASFAYGGLIPNSAAPSFTILGLTPNTPYYVFVRSRTLAEHSCPSVTLVITTKPS